MLLGNEQEQDSDDEALDAVQQIEAHQNRGLQPQTFYCEKCNAEHNEHDKFCATCGNFLPGSKIYCSNCATEHIIGKQFCMNCGSPLEAEQDAYAQGFDAETNYAQGFNANYE